MCLTAWVCSHHARFPWLIASNRDEFFDRDAATRLLRSDAVATASERSSLVAAALAALADRQVPADDALPTTGVPLLRERQLAPAFIHIPAAQAGGVAYGTRCATVIVVEQAGPTRWVHVTERRFDAEARAVGDSHHRFALPEARER